MTRLQYIFISFLSVCHHNVIMVIDDDDSDSRYETASV